MKPTKKQKEQIQKELSIIKDDAHMKEPSRHQKVQLKNRQKVPEEVESKEKQNDKENREEKKLK